MICVVDNEWDDNIINKKNNKNMDDNIIINKKKVPGPSKYSTEECSSKRSILGHGSWAQMHRSTQGT